MSKKCACNIWSDIDQLRIFLSTEFQISMSYLCLIREILLLVT